MQTDDDLFVGPVAVNFQAKALGSGANVIGASPMARGIGPVSRALVVDYVPTTLSANAICLAQIITGASNAIIAGALAVAGVATIPEPFGRSLQFVSTNAGDTTQTVTVTGTDFLGNPMTARITLNGTTVIQGTKAFKTITQVAVSATTVGNLTVGTGDKMGLPVAVPSANLFGRLAWADVLAQDAGTFVAADATAPTNLTGDTRGTYLPSSASNNARRLTMEILLLDQHVGPAAVPYSTASRTGCFGQTPA